MFVEILFMGTVFPGRMMSKNAFINDLIRQIAFEEGHYKGFHMILVYQYSVTI